MAERPGQGGVNVRDERHRPPRAGMGPDGGRYDEGIGGMGPAKGGLGYVRGGSTSGAWRPDRNFAHVDGMKVSMRRERGVTDHDVLRVPLRFQCPPIGDSTREWAHDWPRYTTLRKGERSRPGQPSLMTYALSTMLLDPAAQDDVAFVVWPHGPAPQRILRELRAIMGQAGGHDATAFRLVVAQNTVWDDPLVSGIFAITRLAATQKPGEVGTEYVEITFEEVDPDEVRRKGDHSPGRTHTLKKGDDLYELAKRYYRQPSLWRTIARANKIKGVRAHSAEDLKKWAAKHHKKKLKIPPKPKTRHDERVRSPRRRGERVEID